MGKVVYSLESITKRYEGTIALDGINLDIEEGEIHSLVGKNGAGKSTLTGIMHGSITPTSGRIKIYNREIDKMSPQKAKKYGIFLVPQHPEFSLDLTVADNLFLGNYPQKRSGLIDKGTIYKETEKIIDKLGIEAYPEQYMYRVDLEYRQMLLAAKALWIENSKIIMLDEITATLSLKSKNKLFEILDESVKKEHKTIVFITHRMKEVLELCNRVTVIRDGVKVGTEHVCDITSRRLTMMITGSIKSEEKIEYNPDKQEDLDKRKTLLKFEDYSKEGAFADISLLIREHEVIGFAGLEGAGESDFMRCIIGLSKADRGRAILNGYELNTKTPENAIQKGIAYLTRNREAEGILHGCSISQNIIGSDYNSYINKIHCINEKKVEDTVQKLKKIMNIKMTKSNYAIDTLSGGNKQKALISRMINRRPLLYLLDHVTQGIDIEAKKEVLRTIRQTLAEISTIIMSSESIEEMMEICDRIIVFYKGKIIAEFNRKDFAEDKIFSSMQGFGMGHD